jgi:hypothetical protein
MSRRCWTPLLALLIAVALGGVGASSAWSADEFSVGGLAFTAPAGWRRVPPPSPMRKAMFRVENPSGGSDGAVTFYHFGPGRGGGAEANLARWRRQFTEPPDRLDARIETTELGGHRVHLFRAAGTFLSGAPGGPKTELPNYGFLGAIIEGPGGDVFIRLVAPGPLADMAEPAFRAMVASPFRR